MAYAAKLQDKVFLKRRVRSRIDMQLIKLGIVTGGYMPTDFEQWRRNLIEDMLSIVLTERNQAVMDYRKNLIGGSDGK